MAKRVKSSSGSFNARWRRESGDGDINQPERQLPGARMKSGPHEKLNDEQGIKPLPVNDSRDGAGSGNASQVDKGQLLYSGPRNQSRLIETGNYAWAGA